MSILIANIGTSDLSVSIDGHYYPIGFDRNERNLDYKSLTEEKKKLWNNRDKEIALKLCPELGIEPKTINNDKGEIVGYRFSFRQLTKRIWEEYQKEYKKGSSTWKKRLAVGRIGGVIEKAKNKFSLEKAYIFVTDQSTEDQPEYHPDDTCYLFKLLDAITNIKLEAIPIKDNAVDADSLLEKYYDFFSQNISDSATILVSIKGGTPQMQTALKMQATASGIPNLLFLDPQLNLSKALKGECSECAVTSYWRYLRTQKYQTVKLLLNQRWDFQGARVILEEWQKNLDFLKSNLKEANTEELSIEKENLNDVVKNLNCAVDYLNFASVSTDKGKLHSILNLYTQCRIYWTLDEIANFLPRLGSFYEEAIQSLIVQFGGEKYCKYKNRNKKWTLLKSNLVSNQSLLELFEKAEKTFIWDEKIWRRKTTPKTKDDKSEKIVGYEFILHDEHRLSSRYRKKSFAEALIRNSKDKNSIFRWEKIDKSLNRLNYWVDQRNDLIHGVRGLSKYSMEEKKDNDIRDYNNSSLEHKENPYHPDPSKSCESNQLIKEMSVVCHQIIRLFGMEKSPYVDLKTPDIAKYYLYSDIREKVINQLDN